ncbi:rhombotarget lipoprotein [Echinimonas agarilytica]|uniref:Rhombotarget lipoprotein n=2 Tax=Echinimonas agarilytica TaxID=1215918 RepID=A0AA41W652_9GAMM|nr:rhombotarget lipoprotein [Echinimonas agarilytica]
MSNSGEKNTVSSSLMDFLYPDEESRQTHSSEIPTLRLPVTVGLAFVPTKNRYQNHINSASQIELLDKVKQSFLKYDYIDRIEVIPNDYLQSKGGFDSLEQVSRLYDVDVMALVSYDQVTQSHENNAALLYWTIVGLYVIPGNENSTQTFVDTAVFDVKSRKMLFRAPGINKIEKRTSAVRLDEVKEEASFKGFERAVEDMTINLESELARFKTRVEEEKVAKIEHKKGYSGGAWGMLGVTLLLLLCISKRTRLKV